MKRSCLLLALIIAAFSSDSALPASKKDQTAPQEQKAAPDQRGTEQSPLIVQPLPTKKTAEIAEKEKRETKEKFDSDWWTLRLAQWTLLALFGQLAVFIAQAIYLKGTLTATAEAASAARDAAQVAEKSLNVLEAPVIAIEFREPGIHWGAARHIEFRDVVFTIVNYGRTPAHLLELMDSVDEIPIGQSPPIIDPSKQRGSPMPYGVIAPPQSSSQEFRRPSNINFFKDGYILGDVVNAAWFRGLVRYGDIFGNQFVMGFCFVFDINRDRWVLRGNKTHNYCKRDDATEFPEWIHPSADPNSVRSALNRAVMEVERRE